VIKSNCGSRRTSSRRRWWTTSCTQTWLFINLFITKEISRNTKETILTNNLLAFPTGMSYQFNYFTRLLYLKSSLPSFSQPYIHLAMTLKVANMGAFQVSYTNAANWLKSKPFVRHRKLRQIGTFFSCIEFIVFIG
jgi:hypothetical protein